MLNVTKATKLKAAAPGMSTDATTLHGNATSLAGAAQGSSATDDQALQQKAGENQDTAGTLRYLARELYEAANALKNAVGGTDNQAAQNLATAVGEDEEAEGLRKTLAELATANGGTLQTKAQAVKTAYDNPVSSSGVKQKFEAVKAQKQAYTDAGKEDLYEEVVDAWEAFNKVYDADLKGLATNLATAVGDSGHGLQGTLSNLNTSGTTQNAEDVINKFNEVAGKYKAVKALESTYQAIEATKSQYGNVVSKFGELQQVYDAGESDGVGLRGKAQTVYSRAESLEGELQRGLGSAVDQAAQTAQALVTKLKDAASNAGGSGLEQLLEELSSATFLEVFEKAQKVLYKYKDVEGKYNAVAADPKAKTQISAFGKVKSAFTVLNTDFKAKELKNKAQALHDAANAIVSDAAKGASSTLAVLLSDATRLKEAAKQTGNTGLHHHANQLASHSGDASGEANAVIGAFDELDKHYEALMKLAETNKLTSRSEVTAVIKAYYEVKNTYYQMFITYRIKEKAEAFYGAAQALQTEAKGAGPDKPLLAALNTAASEQMTTLVDNANLLKTEAEKLHGANEATIVTNYLLVADAYEKLSKIPQFTAALKAKNVDQVQAVKDKFEALQKSYENVLRLRVQELSQKADTLYSKVNELSGDLDLTAQANALRDAASHSDSPEGLAQKATALAGAINAHSGVGTQADEVIKQFEAVTEKYEKLTAAAKEKGKQESVQNVETGYNDLKTFYYKILNFTKIKHYATQVETKASQIGTGASPSEVKALIGKLENVYNSMPDDIKSTVQTDFESIKNVVCGVHLDEK